MTDLTKLTAEELRSAAQSRSHRRVDAWAEIRRRLERLEKCETALESYAREERADDTKRLDWIALNWFTNRGEEPDNIENALRLADPFILRGAIDYAMEKDAEFAARIREGQ